MVAVRRRSSPLLLATASLLVLILLALSSNPPGVPGLYLAGSRILLPLPFAVWSLCLAVLETSKRSPSLTNLNTRSRPLSDWPHSA